MASVDLTLQESLHNNKQLLVCLDKKVQESITLSSGMLHTTLALSAAVLDTTLALSAAVLHTTLALSAAVLHTTLALSTQSQLIRGHNVDAVTLRQLTKAW